jgi:DNA polymerase-3 subunit epsilon
MLHLERPLVFLDLEATGKDPQEARIIQVAMQRFVPAEDGAALDDEVDLLVDPNAEIPASVTRLTGIGPADVQGQPTFAELADRLAALVRDADLAGYNAIAYDVPLLKAEFERAGRSFPGPPGRVVLDPYRLEQVLRPRTLKALYERYTGDALQGAHDAMSDVHAAGRVLQRQLAENDIAATPAELAEITRGDYLDDGRKLRRNGETVVVCFGKHSGKTLRAIRSDHPDYFDWMYGAIDELRPHIDEALGEP